MKLLELKLANFRQHRDTTVQFFDGITGILGRNGSGKTTLLESIAWALYGQKAVQRMDRGKAETLRSRGARASDHTEVHLTFELSGQNYTVVRRLNDAALLIGSNKTHTGTEPVTRAVSALLKMDAQAFFTSFFTGQKDLAFLQDVSGPARQQYISRLLGYERLTRARQMANDEKLAVRRDTETLERGLGDIEEIKRQKAEAEAALAAAQTGAKQAAGEKVRTQTALKEIEPLKNASDAREKQHNGYVADARVLETQRASCEKSVQRAQRELAEIDQADRELQTLEPALKEYDELKSRYEELRILQVADVERHGLEETVSSSTQDLSQFLNSATELESRFAGLPAVQKRISELQERLESSKRRLQELERETVEQKARTSAEVDSLETRVREEEEHLGQLLQAGPDGVCPTCERALEGEFDRVTEQMRERIADFSASITKLHIRLKNVQTDSEPIITLKQTIQDTENALVEARKEEYAARKAGEDLKKERQRAADVRERIQTAQKRLAELPGGFDAQEFEQLGKRGFELKPVRKRSQELQAQLSRRDSVALELAEQQESLDAATQALSLKTTALTELAFDADEHAKLTATWQDLSERAAETQNAVVRADGQVVAAQKDLAACKQREDDYRAHAKRLEESRESHRYLDFLTAAFDGFRGELNSQIRPRLSESASELIAQITDGRYNEVDLGEDYTPRLFDDGEYKPVISGGEEDILHLSMRLAISQMIAERAGVDLGLLVLDEVFGSLDEGRRENVISLLQNLKGRFEQILLITHIETIHDMVDRTIWVDYDSVSASSLVRDSRVESHSLDQAFVETESVLVLE